MELLSSIFCFMWSWSGLLIISILTLLYNWRVYYNNIFKRRGIPHIEPSFWFGCSIQNEIMLRKITFIESFNKIYWSQPEQSVTGFMQIVTPVLIVRDVELIKEITVKKFDCFQNHVFSDIPDVDTIFGKSLFSLTDQKWRVTRNMLSPTFTGMKMRTMFKLMHDCAKSTVDALNEKSNGKEVVLEVKDLFNRYCNDTIATTIFGIEVNSMKDKDNEFFLMGKKLTQFGQVATLKFFLVFISPKIFKLLGMNLLDRKASNYFLKLVKDTIQYRIDKKIVRPDMINMYIESLKEDPNHNDKKVIDNEYVIKSDDTEAILKKWDLEEFVCQCALFFFAGFETAAGYFMFLAYELAKNPEIQNTLYEEINEANRNLGDKPLTYEYIQSLKYFDCVIQEALRLWPVNIANDRKCTKDCTLYDSNGKAHEFKKGDNINIMVMAMQRNPKYFENPEKFLPERWFPENRDKINPYTFLTFGIGPRMCIGNRYVMMEGKCLFYTLLSRFRIEKCEKTPDPIIFPKGSFALNPVGGMWLKFVIRDEN